MIGKIESIGQKLLEDMYSHGFSTFYTKNLILLFPKQKERDIKDAVNFLFKKRLIKVTGIDYISHNFFLKDFTGNITDIGVLNIEENDFDDQDKYSIEIIRFLQVIDESSEESLYIDKIIPRIIQKGSQKTEEDLRYFICICIEYTCNVRKTWSGGGNINQLYVNNITSPITDIGMDILQGFISETEILTSPLITNRAMIIEEYDSLVFLIKNKLWKDACIKMGSILEYLLTKWLESKNIKQITHSRLKQPRPLKKAKFYDKIIHYLEIARIIHQNQIGDRTQWEIVDKVIRDYRNYIHLQEYEKKIATDGYLEKNDYELLNIPFNQIISYFK
ncbi:hypothetical protein LCGC14_2288670 [marine sediment metagenome]|uniref:Uncharacterized protein n=1 Tax=marine sediment metagenome TaxID=412755 RepID=A0A0F9F4E2_9ZZZZ